MQWTDLLCPGCGHPRDESMADRAVYDATAVRCHACKAQARAVEPFHAEGDSSGLYVHSTREGDG